jgi:hypothetical protein
MNCIIVNQSDNFNLTFGLFTEGSERPKHSIGVISVHN